MRISGDAHANLALLHPDARRRIRAALDAILADPIVGTELHSELTGLRSLRVGRYRVIYRPRRGIIEIVALGPRSTIYEEAARIIARERAR